MEETNDIVVILLRFMFGIIVAGVLSLFLIFWFAIPIKVLVIFVLVIGILSAFLGDRFLIWFAGIFKFLRSI